MEGRVWQQGEHLEPLGVCHLPTGENHLGARPNELQPEQAPALQHSPPLAWDLDHLCEFRTHTLHKPKHEGRAGAARAAFGPWPLHSSITRRSPCVPGGVDATWPAVMNGSYNNKMTSLPDF